MNMARRMIFFFFLLSSAALASEGGTVLVTIGEQVITEAEFQRMISVYGPEQSRKILSDPRLKSETLRTIVQAIVISRLAADYGFDRRDDVKEGIELVKKTYVAREFLRREVAEKITVTDKDLEDYDRRHGKKSSTSGETTGEIRKEKLDA